MENNVRWHPCRTHIWGLSSKSCIASTNIFCGTAAISWQMESFSSLIVCVLFVYTLHLRYPHKKKSQIDRSGERWKVTTESLFLKNCSTANTRCWMFQCTMATETAMSELSAGSCPMSSTPPLLSTSHLKNMHSLCSTSLALGYTSIEVEVLNLSDHAFFKLQWTTVLDFLIAKFHWLCHFEVQLKFSKFTFMLYIRYNSLNLVIKIFTINQPKASRIIWTYDLEWQLLLNTVFI